LAADDDDRLAEAEVDDPGDDSQPADEDDEFADDDSEEVTTDLDEFEDDADVSEDDDSAAEIDAAVELTSKEQSARSLEIRRAIERRMEERQFHEDNDYLDYDLDD
jgi:hypothetical protein